MSKLETKNLLLKVRALDDVDALLSFYLSLQKADGVPTPFTDRDSVVKSVFLSDTHWRKNGFGYWSIYAKEKLIGNIGLKRAAAVTADRTVHLELEIHPDFRGKGYGQEAAHAVLDFGFRLHKLPEIHAHVKSLNTFGKDCLISLGFQEMNTPGEDHAFVLKAPSKR